MTTLAGGIAMIDITMPGILTDQPE